MNKYIYISQKCNMYYKIVTKEGTDLGWYYSNKQPINLVSSLARLKDSGNIREYIVTDKQPDPKELIHY